jgi:hypothetical protein
MLYPQGKQGRMDGDTRCALGAAAEALGMKASFDGMWLAPMVPYTTLQKEYPILDREMVPPEGIGLNGRYPLMQIIWAMNDSAGWSREQIAEWLEGIEATLDPVHVHVRTCGD